MEILSPLLEIWSNNPGFVGTLMSAESLTRYHPDAKAFLEAYRETRV